MKYLLSLFTMLKAIMLNERGSFEVDTAMIDLFSSNVMHLSQQMESRFLPYVRQETQMAEAKFYDRIGKRSMRRKEGRHSDVVYTDTPHSRRMVVMEDYYDADLVDQEDKIRTIMNLDNEYTQSMAYGLGRKYDEVIIDTALGNAFGGKKGATVIGLPLSQKVAAFDGTATTGLGLNVPTLRAVRKKFKQNESIRKGEEVIFACAAQQIDDLLGSTLAASSDFNSVKALVQGEVDTFMGFKFIESELIPFNDADVSYDKVTGEVVDSGGDGTLDLGEGRRCFAFSRSRSLLIARGREVKGRVDELPNKHYAYQVYCALTVGGTRMEEEQVVEVLCKEV